MTLALNSMYIYIQLFIYISFSPNNLYNSDALSSPTKISTFSKTIREKHALEMPRPKRKLAVFSRDDDESDVLGVCDDRRHFLRRLISCTLFMATQPAIAAIPSSSFQISAVTDETSTFSDSAPDSSYSRLGGLGTSSTYPSTIPKDGSSPFMPTDEILTIFPVSKLKTQQGIGIELSEVFYTSYDSSRVVVK